MGYTIIILQIILKKYLKCILTKGFYSDETILLHVFFANPKSRHKIYELFCKYYNVSLLKVLTLKFFRDGCKINLHIAEKKMHLLLNSNFSNKAWHYLKNLLTIETLLLIILLRISFQSLNYSLEYLLVILVYILCGEGGGITSRNISRWINTLLQVFIIITNVNNLWNVIK